MSHNIEVISARGVAVLVLLGALVLTVKGISHAKQSLSARR